jgi:hypothetical protein
MANADKPAGFRFGYTLHGGPPHITKWISTAAIIYPGDIVSTDGAGLVLSMISDAVPIGVAMNYGAVAGTKDIYVMDDLVNTVFITQADGADLSSHAMQGLYYDVIQTTGSTTTGRSIQELESGDSTHDTLELVGLVERPDNAWGEFCDVYVKIHVDKLIQVVSNSA